MQVLPPCRICKSEPELVGLVHGSYSRRDYHLARCAACGFAFVADPWLEFAEIYDERYYLGEGADPLVDYHFELDHPGQTIRRYEWAGITTVVGDLVGRDRARRWLDYGCGNGSLVRHLRARGEAEAFGFDQGSIVSTARDRGIPIMHEDELAAGDGSFDVVTAIEVIEHTLDPLAELRRMRRLLRPGGLLFLTTGNARPYADRLTRWRYVTPEIHISLFEPQTLALALTNSGFRAEHVALGPGFDDILKFKVLKNLRVRRRSRLTDLLPTRPVAAVADAMAKLGEHPIGWAA